VSHHDDLFLLETLDRPVEPRADFAGDLWLLLESELGMADAAPARHVGWFGRRSIRVRVALVLAALVILGVGAALATRLVGDWADVGHGGLQVRRGVIPEATLDTPNGPEFVWARFALGPQGHDLYATGWSPADIGRSWNTTRSAKLVVYHGVDTAHPTVSQTTLTLPDALGKGWVSVAPTGEVFLGLSRSVVQVDPDGRLQTVVPVGEIRSRGAMTVMSGLDVAAVSAHELILRVDVSGWHGRDYGDFRFYEVTDPNRDGQWGDAAIRRLVLPRSVPVSAPGADPNPWASLQLFAESSAPGGASSTAVIATMLSQGGEFRAYRLDDRNGDGDVTDRGETQLLLDRHPSSAVAFWAPPIALYKASTDGGRPELVAGGLTRAGRISIVSPAGRITDVARSFPTGDELQGMLAGLNGRIYSLVQSTGLQGRLRIFRFTVNPTHADSSTSGVQGPSWTMPRGLQGPVLALTTSDGTLLARASGGAPRPFLNRRMLSPCLSTDGRTIYYAANLEAKNEWFLYAARENGPARKVTEEQVTPVCPAPAGGLLLEEGNGELSQTLVWRTMRTGHRRTIARDVLRFSVSTDGRQLAYVGGLDFTDGWPPRGRERLILMGLPTGQRHVVASAPAGRSFGVPDRTGYDAPPGQDVGVRWSPDGRSIAYVTGPSIYRRALWPAKVHDSDFTTPPQRYTLWVRSATTGKITLRRTIVGGPPSVSWSPSGSQLLVCTNTFTLFRGCPDQLLEAPDYNSSATGSVVPHSATRLLVIDTATGASSNVAQSDISYAQWNPSGDNLAYATRGALYTVDADGRRQLVVRAPGGNWASSPSGTRFAFAVWDGYSPDGRYIAVRRGYELAVIDTADGTIRQPAGNRPVSDAAWWKPGMYLEGSWRPAWG
jgi:hypothetical protein